MPTAARCSWHPLRRAALSAHLLTTFSATAATLPSAIQRSSRSFVEPPSWAPRGRGKGRGKKGVRGYAAQRSALSTDAAGMFLHAVHAHAKEISARDLDAAVAAASATLLGLTDEELLEDADRREINRRTNESRELLEEHNQANPALGAAFDPRKIRFRGRTDDAARLAAAAALAPIATTTTSSTAAMPTALSASFDEAATTGAGLPRTQMHSHPIREDSVSGTQRSAFVAYVRDSRGIAARAPSEAAASGSRTVELDNGERVVAALADTSTGVRKTPCATDLNGAVDVNKRLGKQTPLPAAGTQCSSHSSSPLPPAVRRRMREQRRAAMAHGSTRHPCPLQGGCLVTTTATNMTGSAAVCPLTAYPAVSCAVYLRSGHCAEAAAGCCPWHHGSEQGGGGGAAAPMVMAESLFAEDVADPTTATRVVKRLRDGMPAVGAALQFYVDAVCAALEGPVATIEGGESENPVWGEVVARAAPGAAQQAELVNALRAAAGAGGEGTVLLSLDPSTGALCVDASLACVAATYEKLSTTVTDDAHAVSEAGVRISAVAQELDAMWAEAESEEKREEQAAFATADGNGGAAVNSAHVGAAAVAFADGDPHASSFLHEVRTLWTSYLLVIPPVSEGCGVTSGAQLGLSPLLTDWALARALEQWQQHHQHQQQRPQQQVDRLRAEMQPTLSVKDLFWNATQHLLHRRLTDSASLLSQGLADEALWRLRWAPLSLLRDLLLVQQLADSSPSFTLGAADADRVNPFTMSFLDTPAASLSPRGTTGPQLLDVLRATCKSLENVPSRETAAATAITGVPPSAKARAELEASWAAVHNVLGTIWAGLLRTEEMIAYPPVAITGTNSVITTPIARVSKESQQLLSDMLSQQRRRREGSSPLALSAFSQSPLLRLLHEASQSLGAAHEDALLETAGWQPWTDAQMSATFHSAVYSAAAYVRHHQPMLALACEASLLNALLADTTAWLLADHGLAERSPSRALLQTPVTAAIAPVVLGGAAAPLPTSPGSVVVRWMRHHGPSRSAHRARAADLRSATAVPLAFLNALQELSGSAAAARATLRQTFHARRATYAATEEKRRRSLRTRKYHSSASKRKGGHGGDDEPASGGEELTVPPAAMDVMLPHGTVAVSAAATAGLVRLLLEGGAAYRALRLAVSIARVSRALRQAALEPPPRLVASYKVVHRVHRNPKTARKHVQRMRVPTLRLLRDSGKETGIQGASAAAGGRGARHGSETAASVASISQPSPVGLLFHLGASVVEEVVRLGLRMGSVGAKLADGVLDDCVRGYVADYGGPRCLPAPSSLSEVMSLSFPTDMGVAGRGSVVKDSPVSMLLALRGVTGATAATTPSSFPLISPAKPSYPHARIAPSPLMVELLSAEATVADSARHERSRRLLAMDPTRFATAQVVLARQCALAASYPAWALQAKECVWVCAAEAKAVRECTRRPMSAASPQDAPVLADWRALAAATKGHRSEVEGWAAAPDPLKVPHTKVSHGRRPLMSFPAKAPKTAEELKALLRSQDGNGPSVHHAIENVEDAEACLLRHQPHGGHSEDGLSPREHRRMSTLQRYPLLRYRPEATLVHLWRQCESHHHSGGARQGNEFLWAACAGALLGLPADVLGGTPLTARLAATTLAQAAVAAAELDSYHGRTHEWMGRTFALLAVSSVWAADNLDAKGRGEAAAAAATLLALSSAHTAVVADVAALLGLQARLLQLSTVPTLDGREDANGNKTAALLGHPAAPALLQEASSGADAFMAHTAWPLLAALPTFSLFTAITWLRVTYLEPSAVLLAWLVAHVDSRNPEGLVAMLRWLEALAGAGHEPAALFVPTVTELLRRARYRQHARHT